MTQRSARAVLAPGAKCHLHRERAATGVCARCGDFLCGRCGTRVELTLMCGRCAERTLDEHSPRSVYALVLGLLAVVPPLHILAPIGLVLSLLELFAIRDRAAPLGGRGLARVGLIGSVLGIAMPMSAVLAYLATR